MICSTFQPRPSHCRPRRGPNTSWLEQIALSRLQLDRTGDPRGPPIDGSSILGYPHLWKPPHDDNC